MTRAAPRASGDVRPGRRIGASGPVDFPPSAHARHGRLATNDAVAHPVAVVEGLEQYGGGAQAPTRDLDTPEEIGEMVRRFYADVAQDDLLGPMFNDVARVDWSAHLPKLTDFWCRALLGLPGYVGNPFRAHSLVHEKRPFTGAHFERWLSLFHETLELGWTGPRATRAGQLADDVARVHSHHLVGDPGDVR
jgi:hemoglobin